MGKHWKSRFAKETSRDPCIGVQTKSNYNDSYEFPLSVSATFLLLRSFVTVPLPALHCV